MTRGFHPPQQRRSRDTLHRLVAATESLLVEGGPDAATVHEIVAASESSVGSFYARFDDRETAVRYVQDRFWREAELRWENHFADERAADRPAAQLLARMIRSLVRALAADRPRYRAFVRLALARPELGLAERCTDLDRRIARGAAELLADTAAGPATESLRDAAERGMRCVLSTCRDAMLFGEEDPRADRLLILTLVQLMSARLDLSDAPATYGDLLRLCKAESDVPER